MTVKRLPTEQELNELIKQCKGKNGSTYIKLPSPLSEANKIGLSILKCIDDEKKDDDV